MSECAKNVVNYPISVLIHLIKMSPRKNAKQEESMEEIVKRCLQDALQDSSMLTRIANLVTEAVATAVADFSAALKRSSEVIEGLKTALDDRDKKIERLEGRIDDLEQYQRRQCLRIFGCTEEEGENTDDIVLKVAEKVGANIEIGDIDRSHRVGRQQVTGRPRAIIVKFVSYRKRSEVFRSKRNLKGTGITIREDLTRARHQLLREAITKHGVNNVWTQDGVVIIKEGNAKRRLRSLSELN